MSVISGASSTLPWRNVTSAIGRSLRWTGDEEDSVEEVEADEAPDRMGGREGMWTGIEVAGAKLPPVSVVVEV